MTPRTREWLKAAGAWVLVIAGLSWVSWLQVKDL